jgi:protein phosphatase
LRISQSSAASNTGRKRRHNEDAYVCDPPLFAVADGMGGAQAGEVASSLAANTLREGELATTPSGEPDLVSRIQNANLRVHERALSDSTASGMGTTMTVALLVPERGVIIGHVGDSRAYLFREDRLEQLTQDHSLVAELVRRGELSVEQAEVHPQRSVITRALGTEPEVEIDSFTVPVHDGDVFLLCSDGLTTMVDGDTIAGIVRRHRDDLQEASRILIRTANDRGGEDNITAVLFAIAADDAGEPPAGPDALGRPGVDDDTLHPEDAVPALSLEDTLQPVGVVASAPAVPVAPPGEQTMIVPVAALDQPHVPETAGWQDPDESPQPPAEAWRILLGVIAVVVLTALILVILVKGFML